MVWSWVVGLRMSWVEKIRKINLRGRRERRLLGAQEYLPTCWWKSVFWRWCIIIIIITLFIVDSFQMYKLKCENYNNLQYIYTYIKIHKS